MILTPEQQALLDGAKGETMAKVVKTLVMYGDAFGAILGDVWTDASMPVVDQLGEEFLAYVKTGLTVTVKDDGVV